LKLYDRVRLAIDLDVHTVPEITRIYCQCCCSTSCSAQASKHGTDLTPLGYQPSKEQIGTFPSSSYVLE
jgi:hypothetical protein